jgi:alkylation response protein AidB-like acyl-CoA dehydrogenase
MQFGLSESQQILKDTARKFFAGESPIATVRKAMETETAYDAALWTKLAEQGFTGIITPEEYGGMGLGKVELILLMEEAGYALLPGLKPAHPQSRRKNIWHASPAARRVQQWHWLKRPAVGIRAAFRLHRLATS